MKHIFQFFLLGCMSLLLGACSLNKDVAKLYKQEAPLQVEIILPDQMSSDKLETIQAVLTQAGKRVDHADFVHFEIWKKDGSVTYGMEQAIENGDGTYSLGKSFDQEGLYVIKVHAGNEGSTVMPRKQFIVGSLSEKELHSLEETSQIQAGSGEAHH